MVEGQSTSEMMEPKKRVKTVKEGLDELIDVFITAHQNMEDAAEGGARDRRQLVVDSIRKLQDSFPEDELEMREEEAKRVLAALQQIGAEVLKIEDEAAQNEAKRIMGTLTSKLNEILGFKSKDQLRVS